MSASTAPMGARAARAPAVELAIAHPLVVIGALWLAQMLYLAALHAAGLGYGFAVWPMGEDRNWLRVMLELPGVSFTRQFWLLDQRNPLSPWWYALIERPALAYAGTLYLARKLVELLLALAVTVLVDRLQRGRNRGMAISAGILVLACTFNHYREQIIWNFLLALALGLAAVAAYVRYVDQGRRNGFGLGLSLVLLLASVATYSLFAGLGLAVAVVALLRDRRAANMSIRMMELALFTAWIVAFVCIWYTASPLAANRFAMQPSLAVHNLLPSMRSLLWHQDFTEWIGAALRSPRVLLTAAPLCALYAATVMLVETHTGGPSRSTAVGRMASANVAKWPSIGWLAAVFVAVALPVIIIESSTRAWYPGSRSRMVYEVTAPLLVVIAAAIISPLTRKGRAARVRLSMAAALPALAAAVFVAAGVAYNGALNETTAAQRRFASELERVVAAHPAVRSVLVRYAFEPEKVWGSDVLSDTIARTLLPGGGVTMRLMPFLHPSRQGPPPWWRPVIDADDAGVAHAQIGDMGYMPYGEVLFVAYDGQRMSVPGTIGEDWFAGLDVDWRRRAPVLQNRPVAAPCPATFDFSRTPTRGRGWSVPEKQPDGSHATWMAATSAELAMPTSCAGAVEIRLVAVNAMAPDILDGLRLRVDGDDVPLARESSSASQTVLRGTTRVDPTQRWLRLALTAPRTIVPAGGDRTLAVMLREIRVSPARGVTP